MARLGEQITVLVGWIKERSKLLLTILVIIPLLLFVWVTWKTWKLDNLGFGVKTYWDWMELLVIPIVLAIGAWWLNKSEKETEREIAKEKRNQDTLEAYFDRMAELLIEHKLTHNESEKETEILSDIARTRTLAVLRTLDGKRKGQVIQFLYEANLITPIPTTAEAGLISSKRVMIELRGADLRGAILSRANLRGAILYGADLSGASLSGASLSGARLHAGDLNGADLTGADLSNIDLRWASLNSADLSKTILHGADLTSANLSGTSLSGAYLRKAIVTNEQLAQAKSLKGAILPDGTKHD